MTEAAHLAETPSLSHNGVAQSPLVAPAPPSSAGGLTPPVRPLPKVTSSGQVLTGGFNSEYKEPEAAAEAVAKYHEGHFLGAQIKVELSHARLPPPKATPGAHKAEDGKPRERNPPGSDRPSDARKPMHINGPPGGEKPLGKPRGRGYAPPPSDRGNGVPPPDYRRDGPPADRYSAGPPGPLPRDMAPYDRYRDDYRDPRGPPPAPAFDARYERDFDRNSSGYAPPPPPSRDYRPPSYGYGPPPSLDPRDRPPFDPYYDTAPPPPRNASSWGPPPSSRGGPILPGAPGPQYSNNAPPRAGLYPPLDAPRDPYNNDRFDSRPPLASSLAPSPYSQSGRPPYSMNPHAPPSGFEGPGHDRYGAAPLPPREDRRYNPYPRSPPRSEDRGSNGRAGDSIYGGRSPQHRGGPPSERRRSLSPRRGDFRGSQDFASSAAFSPTLTANVYVRLLPQHTRDSDLLSLGSLFAPVVSVKALLDRNALPRERDTTYYDSRESSIPRPQSLLFSEPSCRGVGFILYQSVDDATKAIIGLVNLGFDASFAKESVGMKLKQLADVNSANLYLSNIPQSYGEEDLEQLFFPALVKSVRLLRHTAEFDDGAPGLSRGVGFARLGDRESADVAIARLKDAFLPGSTLPLKIRYADSPQQRNFKATLPARTSPARRRHLEIMQNYSLGMITPPFVSLLPSRNIPRSDDHYFSISPTFGRSTSSQYSSGSTATSGSPRRRPTSSRTTFTPPSSTRSAPTPHTSPTKKGSSAYSPSAHSSHPSVVFPPTPPHSPIKHRPTIERLSYGTSPQTPTIKPVSALALKPTIIRPTWNPNSRRNSAGPLRTRFRIPYEALIEEDIEELEIACESLEEMMSSSKRLTEPRKSLP
ncbi:hypothetical protein P7C70_g3370, partial [Phenoliferia sp. Uapishka_3]